MRIVWVNLWKIVLCSWLVLCVTIVFVVGIYSVVICNLDQIKTEFGFNKLFVFRNFIFSFIDALKLFVQGLYTIKIYLAYSFVMGYIGTELELTKCGINVFARDELVVSFHKSRYKTIGCHICHLFLRISQYSCYLILSHHYQFVCILTS